MAKIYYCVNCFNILSYRGFKLEIDIPIVDVCPICKSKSDVYEYKHSKDFFKKIIIINSLISIIMIILLIWAYVDGMNIFDILTFSGFIIIFIITSISWNWSWYSMEESCQALYNFEDILKRSQRIFKDQMKNNGITTVSIKKKKREVIYREMNFDNSLKDLEIFKRKSKKSIKWKENLFRKTLLNCIIITVSIGILLLCCASFYFYKDTFTGIQLFLLSILFIGVLPIFLGAIYLKIPKTLGFSNYGFYYKDHFTTSFNKNGYNENLIIWKEIKTITQTNDNVILYDSDSHNNNPKTVKGPISSGCIIKTKQHQAFRLDYIDKHLIEEIIKKTEYYSKIHQK